MTVRTTDRPVASGGRTYGTYLNYILSVSAVGLLMAGMVAFVGWRQEENLPSVDYRADLAVVAELADYQVYAPNSGELPQGWTATSSRMDDSVDAAPDPDADATGTAAAAVPDADAAEEEVLTWEVGFATASDEYASMRISDADPEVFVAEMTEDGKEDGSSEIDDQSWQRQVNSAGDRRSLVWETGEAEDQPEATIVVTGTAEYEELASLAAAIEPYDPENGT